MNLRQYANKLRLTIKLGAWLNPTLRDDWQRTSPGYRCILRHGGRRYTFDYWQPCGIKRIPEFEDVLKCLEENAKAGALPLERFCDSYFHEVDSKRSTRVWNVCRNVRRNMRRILEDSKMSSKRRAA